METKNVTKYEFEKEIQIMAVSCIGVKERTAKKKASNIFKKYEEIIAYSEEDKDWYEKQYRKYQNMFNVLKEGVIRYGRGEEMSGVLLLKNVEQVECRKNDVLITTKEGREIVMGDSFKFLKDLF